MIIMMCCLRWLWYCKSCVFLRALISRLVLHVEILVFSLKHTDGSGRQNVALKFSWLGESLWKPALGSTANIRCLNFSVKNRLVFSRSCWKAKVFLTVSILRSSWPSGSEYLLPSYCDSFCFLGWFHLHSDDEDAIV